MHDMRSKSGLTDFILHCICNMFTSTKIKPAFRFRLQGSCVSVVVATAVVSPFKIKAGRWRGSLHGDSHCCRLMAVVVGGGLSGVVAATLWAGHDLCAKCPFCFETKLEQSAQSVIVS